MRRNLLIVLLTAALLIPGKTFAADTVHLFLRSNGVDIKGESTKTTLGRKDSIECLKFESAVSTTRETGSGLVTSRRQYEPIVILKRIDRSSPLLMKALTNNELITGDFKLYRLNPTDDGTTDQFYTIID